MSRFFIPRENISENKIVIKGEDVIHISRVLRLKAGDFLTCCDGKGFDYLAEISNISKSEIVCNITKKEKSDTEPPVKITLIQGIPKASKMDYIIQKNTELGICKIYPCSLNRSISKTEKDKKTARWQRIAKEAAQQSGRGVIPEIYDAIDLKDAVGILKGADISFVAYECEENNTLKDVLLSCENPKTVAFLIGPEGGFDKSEIEFLENNGISVISLGKRILRTETAGEAVLAMIMYEIGDINCL
ncbi:MAG TPA: 16S rRNA (uracil(1498)-N(3))-methyltransferase [Clostridiales bacterium]|nr:16S rRNA (uracil(1498)-N(3))-methyltransferase [Clostridiales bacterium]